MLFLVIAGILLLILVLMRFQLGFYPIPPDLELGVASTIGNREVQADAFDYARTSAGLMMVVADGIGFSEKGKVSSMIAVETCKSYFESLNYFDNPGFFFRKAFMLANQNILQAIDDNSGGANILSAVVFDGHLYHALVGNCVLWVYRKGNLIPVSEGHTVETLVKQSYKLGRLSRQETLAAMKDHRIYNYIGQDGFQNIEYYDRPIQLFSGDIVIMLTDGVLEVFGERKLEDLLAENMGAEAMSYAVTDTIAATTIEGDKDNATVMILKVNNVR